MRAGVLIPARSMAALRAGSPSTTLGSSAVAPKMWRSSSSVTRSCPFQSPATGTTAGPPSTGTDRTAAGSSRFGTGRSMVAASRRRSPTSSRPSPSQSPATGNTPAPVASSVAAGRATPSSSRRTTAPSRLMVEADAVPAVAVPVADDRQRVGPSGRAERDRGRLDAHVDQHDERGLALPVEAHGVAAVAVEVAGDRPHVGPARLAERQRRKRSPLVVSQREHGVGARVEADRVAAVTVPVAGDRHLVGTGRAERECGERRARLVALAERARGGLVPAHAVDAAADLGLRPGLQVGVGIDGARLGAGRLAAQVDLEVDVGCGRPGVAGATDPGDHLAAGNALALGHQVLHVVRVVVRHTRVALQPQGDAAEALVGAVGADDDPGLDGDDGHALVGHEVVALVLAGAAVTAGVPAVGVGDLVRGRDGEDVVGGRLDRPGGWRRTRRRLGSCTGSQAGEHEGGHHRGPDDSSSVPGALRPLGHPVVALWHSCVPPTMAGRLWPRQATPPGCRSTTACSLLSAPRPVDSGGLRKPYRTDVRPAVTVRPRPGHAEFAPGPAPWAVSPRPPPAPAARDLDGYAPVPRRDRPVACAPCGWPT